MSLPGIPKNDEESIENIRAGIEFIILLIDVVEQILDYKDDEDDERKRNDPPS